jgi:RimJ/RimL family protein N-acetyltransferase
MNLKSQRLVLRRPESTDVQALFQIYGDSRTNAFNPSGPLPSLTHAADLMNRWQSHWREHGFGLWAIESVDAQTKVIGFGGLSYAMIDGRPRVHVGYRFAVDAWGQGFATELARYAIEFGLRDLSLDEVLAFVRPAHTASRKVLEKAGMKECGTLDDVPDAAPSVLYTISAISLPAARKV